MRPLKENRSLYLGFLLHLPWLQEHHVALRTLGEKAMLLCFLIKSVISVLSLDA